MRDALFLLAALMTSVAGLGWLALSMEAHWRQVRSTRLPSPTTLKLLRLLGAGGLLTSLLLCLAVDHASMALLVWVMALAAAALIVALTLTWRARWLAPLAAWIRLTPLR